MEGVSQPSPSLLDFSMKMSTLTETMSMSLVLLPTPVCFSCTHGHSVCRLFAIPNVHQFFWVLTFNLPEAVNCNHRVVVWNLVEHWQWENVYEVVPAAAGMELSWIILNCISGFENYINSAGSVVLNAFKKALNYYTLSQNPLFQITCAKKTVTNWNALAEHLVCPPPLYFQPLLITPHLTENAQGSCCTKAHHSAEVLNYLKGPVPCSRSGGVCYFYSNSSPLF
jgi:hypothetical protein